MENIYIIPINAVSILLYIAMGFGAARCEKKARNACKVSLVTVFLWPAALMTWAVSEV